MSVMWSRLHGIWPVRPSTRHHWSRRSGQCPGPDQAGSISGVCWKEFHSIATRTSVWWRTVDYKSDSALQVSQKNRLSLYWKVWRVIACMSSRSKVLIYNTNKR